MLLLLTAAGCGAPRLGDRLERSVTVRDLLSGATGSAADGLLRPTDLTVTVTVPENAVLRLTGAARMPAVWPALIGRVGFVVEADGQALFKRSLWATRWQRRLDAQVDLGAVAGKTVTLTFRLEQSRPAGFWRGASLEQLHETPRRVADAGPNLLLVVVEALRADHCSLYGYQRPTTPTLERLAAESLVFDHAISPSSWTLPSVASLLTGLYPTEHAVVAGGSCLRPELSSLAEVMQEHGLTTIGVSANRLISGFGGFDQGFEFFRELPEARAADVNRSLLTLVDQAKGRQWFAYVHYFDPHDPYDAPAPERRRFTDRSYNGPLKRNAALQELCFTQNFGLPSTVAFDQRDVDHLAAAYDEEVLHWDRNLGLLLERLRQRKLLDTTLLVVTADHGEELAEHGRFKHGRALYQESVRVPLLLRLPGTLAPGRVEPAVEIRTLRSIVLRLLGFGDQELHGEDLRARTSAPLFTHTARALEPRKVWPRESLAAVLDGRWKLIRTLDTGAEELFDLDADPHEKSPLGSQQGAEALRLRQLLDAWQVGAKAPAEEPVDPERLQALRALGYVQ